VTQAPGEVWLRIALPGLEKDVDFSGVDELSVGGKISERLAHVFRVGIAKQGGSCGAPPINLGE
jgi:hypothetical protein